MGRVVEVFYNATSITGGPKPNLAHLSMVEHIRKGNLVFNNGRIASRHGLLSAVEGVKP